MIYIIQTKSQHTKLKRKLEVRNSIAVPQLRVTVKSSIITVPQLRVTVKSSMMNITHISKWVWDGHPPPPPPPYIWTILLTTN